MTITVKHVHEYFSYLGFPKNAQKKRCPDNMNNLLAFNSEKVRYQILKKVEYHVNFKNRARNKTRALSQITKGSLPYINNYLPLIISHYNFLTGIRLYSFMQILRSYTTIA